MFSFLKRLFSRKPMVPNDGRPADYGTDSEFMAEVVRITEIKPHSNADKLELAFFATTNGPSSYQCIVQKGDYRVGDLAGYFSVDCLLPVSNPAFSFLGTRLDGVGKAVYRLRAARLRGLFSQGLLTRLNAANDAGVLRQLGDYLGTEFGVTYHRADEPTEKGPTQATRKPKVQPFPIYTVDSLKKLPNLFSEGEPLLVTEKIHGTNFRFGWVRNKFLGIPFGWKFLVGSHRVMKTGEGKHWYGEDVYNQAAEKMKLADRVKSRKGDIFYGELYGHTYTGQKIQDLVYGRDSKSGPGLAIFDIRTDDDWMPAHERLALLETLGLSSVPVLLESASGEVVDPAKLSEGKSLIDPKQIREGVVVESVQEPRRKAKYVSQAYLLRKDA